MRRYKLNIGAREFVIDVQELASDRFAVTVGGEDYEVNLASEEDLADTIVTPNLTISSTASGATIVPRSHKDASGIRQAPSSAHGKGFLNAPMPGVIIEISVKVGDRVERGQQIAILDAMKMHNMIGAPLAGVIAEIFVSEGQTVAHGNAIAHIKESSL